MSKDIVEKKRWSKRQPGTTLTGFAETVGRIAMVDMVLPNRVVGVEFLVEPSGSSEHCMPSRGSPILRSELQKRFPIIGNCWRIQQTCRMRKRC